MKRGSQMRTSFTMIKNPPGFLKRCLKATQTIKSTSVPKQQINTIV